MSADPVRPERGGEGPRALPESPLLSVRGLKVSFPGEGGVRRVAVGDASLSVYPRQMVALVGESGSGKSVTAMSVLRLLPRGRAEIEAGDIRYRADAAAEATVDLRRIGDRELRRVRGRDIAMIFQEPMTSLNPVFRVGEQISESVRVHLGLRGREAADAATAAMVEARIQDPERRFNQYPHELSGGLRQRVMIAMALAGRPRVLLADEPTTALDVTIQAEILDLIRGLKRNRGLGVLFITHDLGVVAEHADVVCVMYAGHVVECARVGDIFERPLHPYTRALLACAPRLETRRDRSTTIGERGASMTTSGPGGGTWWPGDGSEEHGLIEVEPRRWVRMSGVGAAACGWPDLPYRRPTDAVDGPGPSIAGEPRGDAAY